MNMKKTEKKLLKRLEEMEKVCPITNDRELLKALEKIADEEISSDKPDLTLVDETVKFTLYIKGYDEVKTENDAEGAKVRFYEKIKDSRIVSYAKKRFSRSAKLAIAIVALMILTVGAFASSISLGIADMDGYDIKTIEKNKVCEDENHTVVISEDMFVYYDSVDEMMETEGLESVYLPEDEIEQIKAANVFYTSKINKRHIKILFKNDIQIDIRKDINSFHKDMNTKKIGNYDVEYITSNGFLNGIFIIDGYEYSILSSSASEEEISEIIKNLKEYKR